jgi:transketolase N-terminal domain/subunit
MPDDTVTRERGRPVTDTELPCRAGSPLNDHPNMKLAPGIDFSSGSFGHKAVRRGGHRGHR